MVSSVRTAERMAVLECANWCEGGCRGIDTQSAFAVPLARCLLRDKLPCKYFEGCLLPLRLRRAEYSGVGAAYIQQTRRDLRKSLARIEDEGTRKRTRRHPFFGRLPEKSEAAGRHCECGAPLPKGKRLCPTCRAERRRATYREQRRKQRAQGGVLCTTVL